MIDHSIERAVLDYAATVSAEFDDDLHTSPQITDEDVSAVVQAIGREETKRYPSLSFEAAFCTIAAEWT